MERPPKECPNCSGYGLLFNVMHTPLEAEPEPEEKKPGLPIYYPERQVATVSADTLELWKGNCRKEIEGLESKKTELLGGIAQIDRELLKRTLA